MSRPARLLVYHDPPLEGPENMARDEHLLENRGLTHAALRIYGWSEPTLSLGCFQRYALLADLPAELRRLPVVRRQTGGGAILHDREITYCLALDSAGWAASDGRPMQPAAQGPAALYALVHRVWRDVLAGPAAGDDAAAGAQPLLTELAPDSFPLPTPRTGPFFCFAKPGRTDLLLGGRKVLGSAQRRLTDRVLQHGSLILENRFAAHPAGDLAGPDEARVAAWIAEFIERLAVELELTPVQAAWSAEQLADVRKRRARFAGREWLEKY